ncbi:hypothetical protein C8R47DRAFT_1221951 [Mycena vitilis]|nr:hypothetical protein C8R47DRAFT_1221951 [Mycena vitilis]
MSVDLVVYRAIQLLEYVVFESFLETRIAAPTNPCDANTISCLHLLGDGPPDAGTLMFSEIEDMIASVGSDQPVFDEAAAGLVRPVHYQLCSYDDQQTLDMKKLQYANGIYLSGTMVWSLDQDDSSYPALSG